jgi:hypothetical protein
MERENISTENTPKGSARNQSDTLDRENEDVAPGQRQWSADSKKKPDGADRSPMEDAGSPGGTAGMGGTDNDQDD